MQPELKEKKMAKIAILTNFMDFNPGYSLTGIAKDQVIMLLRHGHKVNLFVNSNYNKDSGSPVSDEEIVKFGGDPKNYQMVDKIPFQNLTDYHSISTLSAEDKTSSMQQKRC